jgi:anti-sigma B factor antagonist
MHLKVDLLPTAAVIHVRGEMTGFAEEELMNAYNEASENQARTLVLDFSELGYMNSTGIGLLVTLLIRTQRRQQRLLACGLSEHYRQIFDLTRLNEAIGLYDTEVEALASTAEIRSTELQ